MGSRPPALKPVVAALLLVVGIPHLGSAQENEAALPEEETPAPRQTPEEREADLLGQLAAAEDPHSASLVATELKGMWSRSGSAAVDLLWKRGQDALMAGAPDQAVEHFTAAIDWAPGFAEAYVGRASAYYLTGDPGPAVADLRAALALNPHQWEALGGFAVLLEEIGDEDAALEVWRRVTEINPQDEAATASVARLETALAGRAL